MDAKSSKSARVASLEAELKARLLFALEAVLMAVVLLSLAFPGVSESDRHAILAGLAGYAAIVLAARLLRRLGIGPDWVLAVQILAMVPFITWSMWFSDKLDSPLRSAYLVVVIASALTQSMRWAMAHCALIGISILALEETHSMRLLMSFAYQSSLLTRLAPLVVVAYVASAYAALFRFDLNRGRLAGAIDAVTGLRNLAGFTIIADRLLMSAERRGNSAALLLYGVDGYEGLVARHGQPAVDKALRGVAARLSARMRHNDLAARCAEDEFVVWLPDTPPAGARELARRLQLELAAAGDGGVECPLSVGVVSHVQGHVSLAQILAWADDVLAAARQSGGDRIAEFQS
jgi:diguanylate cyclase (GGDEF)-like protein